MIKKSREVMLISMYGGFLFSLIGAYWKYGVFMWLLGIMLFSFIFSGVLISYLFLRRAVLFVYENYIKFFPDTLQEDEKRKHEK